MDKIEVLLIGLILLMIGVFPAWPYSIHWGFYPVGAIGLIMLIVMIRTIKRTSIAAGESLGFYRPGQLHTSTRRFSAGSVGVEPDKAMKGRNGGRIR